MLRGVFCGEIATATRGHHFGAPRPVTMKRGCASGLFHVESVRGRQRSSMLARTRAYSVKLSIWWRNHIEPSFFCPRRCTQGFKISWCLMSCCGAPAPYQLPSRPNHHFGASDFIRLWRPCRSLFMKGRETPSLGPTGAFASTLAARRFARQRCMEFSHALLLMLRSVGSGVAGLTCALM